MAHKYPNVLVHCTFATKERREIIPRELLTNLDAYLGGIGRNIRVTVLEAGGTTNHVHLLIVLPSNVTLAKAIQTFKAKFVVLDWGAWGSVRMAGRVRRLRRQRVASGCCACVHCAPSRASFTAIVRG
jgi:REP element-mobilizing transposase RayT